ncbi:MAG: ferritin-like domain-containing protein [Chloroflexota bacterium]|nr:ferritin-like domain-containing protein [Chloroflexota bacterium]
MSTHMYTLPVEQTQWSVDGKNTTVFNWEYDENRDKLLNLYEKGKDKQWNANTRLDWTQEVDPENPLGIPDKYNPLFGTPLWKHLDRKTIAQLKLHSAAWEFSQFLHGEQGALICTSKIVQTVPDIDAKFYAATQVMDEARHVEAYSRYLREKLGLAYPIDSHLKALLDNILQDSRWDFTYLGMQILVEGLALAAFSVIRDGAHEPLAQALTAYVMQDEARHVAFGRLSLRDYYPQLSEKERDEREEFVAEACYMMRDRFMAEEIYQNLGFDLKEVKSYLYNNSAMNAFRLILFSRIVPAIKEIGLWGPKVQKAFTDLGVITFATLNPDELIATDEKIARQFDDKRQAVAKEVTATDSNPN